MILRYSEFKKCTYHVNWVLLIPCFVWKFSKICSLFRNTSPAAVPSRCFNCQYNMLFEISLHLSLWPANMYPREFETPFNRLRNTGISLNVNDKGFFFLNIHFTAFLRFLMFRTHCYLCCENYILKLCNWTVYCFLILLWFCSQKPVKQPSFVTILFSNLPSSSA